MSSDPAVAPASDAADFVAYLFAYFSGDSRDGESIRFAISDGNDALHWLPLFDGRPAAESSCGTGGLRDPFLLRKADGSGFVLLATDLSIGSGTSWRDATTTGSRHIELFESVDLVTWSEQRHVEIAPAWAGDAWAPEAVWDERFGRYLVFWASTTVGENGEPSHHRMYLRATDDFTSFGDVVLWQDPGESVIDASVLRIGDRWHRFTKDDGGRTGCADILHESSADLTAPSPSSAWREVSRCIGHRAGAGPVEGPIPVRSNPGDVNGDVVYLFVDEYASGQGYVPLLADDIGDPVWRRAADHRLPPGARHGGILPITAIEADALRAHGA